MGIIGFHPEGAILRPCWDFRFDLSQEIADDLCSTALMTCAWGAPLFGSKDELCFGGDMIVGKSEGVTGSLKENTPILRSCCQQLHPESFAANVYLN